MLSLFLLNIIVVVVFVVSMVVVLWPLLLLPWFWSFCHCCLCWSIKIVRKLLLLLSLSFPWLWSCGLYCRCHGWGLVAIVVFVSPSRLFLSCCCCCCCCGFWRCCCRNFKAIYFCWYPNSSNYENVLHHTSLFFYRTQIIHFCALAIFLLMLLWRKLIKSYLSSSCLPKIWGIWSSGLENCIVIKQFS